MPRHSRYRRRSRSAVVSSLGLRWWVTRTLCFFLLAVPVLPDVVAVVSLDWDFLLAAKADEGRALRLTIKHKAKRAFIEERRA